MTLTSAEIESILPEISQLAGRAVLQRVLEVDAQTRILQLRVPGDTHYLCLCTQPKMTRVHFISQRAAQPPTPTAFTMQLRRWLQGALFERVTQVQGDRVVRLDFLAVDPDWQPDEDELAAEDSPQRAPRLAVALVVELTGRHPNWYLLDAQNTIIGQATGQSLGQRALQPGARYQPPAGVPHPTRAARVRWGLEALDPKKFERSKALEAQYGAQVREQNFETYLRDLRSRLKKRLKKLERRVSHIEGDYARAEGADEFRRRGELLQSAWGKVERGATSVRVPDFYDEALTEVEIPLDPALSLKKNIAYNFHEYRRLKDAHAQIEERLLQTMELRDAAAEALQKLDAIAGQQDDRQAERLAQLKALAGALESAGTLKPERKQPQRARASDPPRRLPYRKFRSYHGSSILVGRGGADNDKLSMHIARGRDLWLHARDWAGSHVVLRMEQRGEEIKNEDLLDAATLAAWFSKGKNDTLIDISYTRAKYIRKPKGFPPGRVTVGESSTLGLSLEPQRLKRLLETEE